jgi:membrane-associated protein
MELVQYFIDFFINLDERLSELIQYAGIWTYLVLFAIIFAETGLVVTPVLPGDSLLFAAGAFCANGSLNLLVLMTSLFVAAVIGDTVNYAIGNYLGPRVFRENMRYLNRKHLDRTHDFFERYGGKTIVIARFVPIVRTFAPFVAGAGSMTYSHFIFYNVFGAALWVSTCTLAGYFFGNIPFVKKHFELVIIGIIVVSLLPAVFEFARAHLAARRARG